MSSVGRHLRELREARGVSQKEIARSTRVHERYIQALESDDFTDLPAVVFTKGYIRAYCQILNESPEEALGLYAEQTGLPGPRREAERISGPIERNGRGPEPILISLVLLIVLGAALFGLTLVLKGRSRPAAPSAERQTGVRLAASSEPAAVLGSSAPDARDARPALAPPDWAGGGRPPADAGAPMAPANPQGPPFRLVARVKEKTWVRVRTADGHVTEETMTPGDVRQWVSDRRFVVTVGNAGGLALELNGQPLPPLGPSGSVITQLVIPPDAR